MKLSHQATLNISVTASKWSQTKTWLSEIVVRREKWSRSCLFSVLRRSSVVGEDEPSANPVALEMFPSILPLVYSYIHCYGRKTKLLFHRHARFVARQNCWYTRNTRHPGLASNSTIHLIFYSLNSSDIANRICGSVSVISLSSMLLSHILVPIRWMGKRERKM